MGGGGGGGGGVGRGVNMFRVQSHRFLSNFRGP